MGNLGCSCHVDCVEQALGVDSALSSEDTRVKSLEVGRLNWLGGLTAVVSIGVMQAISCTVRVPGWDTACKGKHVFGGHLGMTGDVGVN